MPDQEEPKPAAPEKPKETVTPEEVEEIRKELEETIEMMDRARSKLGRYRALIRYLRGDREGLVRTISVLCQEADLKSGRAELIEDVLPDFEYRLARGVGDDPEKPK